MFHQRPIREKRRQRPGRIVALLAITTHERSFGWADVETRQRASEAIVNAPSGGAAECPSLKPGMPGENPLEHERRWQTMHRNPGYDERPGAAIQMTDRLVP